MLNYGSRLPADLIVYATGYGSMNGWAAKLISQEVADKVGRCWSLEHIISVAHWQMSNLHQQLGRDGHVVLLTDARGVAIDSVFNESERAEFQRSGLWLGSVWSEDCEGTNGVGTCLVERQHVTIRRNPDSLWSHELHVRSL